MVKCCVKDCKSKNDLHLFPLQLMRFIQWTYLIGRTDIVYSRRKNYRICDLHFTEDMKVPMFRGRLSLDAFPTLHLPPGPNDDIVDLVPENTFLLESSVDENVEILPENLESNLCYTPPSKRKKITVLVEQTKNKMDLKKKIDESGQLQAHRKSENLKIAFTAKVKAEEGLPSYQANITVIQGVSISIIEQNAIFGFPRRNVLFIAEHVDTYASDGNTLMINFKVFQPKSQKPDTLLMFQNTEQRQAFEISFRTFMGYSNPEDANL